MKIIGFIFCLLLIIFIILKQKRNFKKQNDKDLEELNKLNVDKQNGIAIDEERRGELLNKVNKNVVNIYFDGFDITISIVLGLLILYSFKETNLKRGIFNICSILIFVLTILYFAFIYLKKQYEKVALKGVDVSLKSKILKEVRSSKKTFYLVGNFIIPSLIIILGIISKIIN